MWHNRKADALPGDPHHLDMIEDLKGKTCVTRTQLHIQYIPPYSNNNQSGNGLGIKNIYLYE